MGDIVMRKGTATKAASSHAGSFDGFEVKWVEDNVPVEAWYVIVAGENYGPHATSQAAFSAVVHAIDQCIMEEART
jgi:hypothetical protein